MIPTPNPDNEPARLRALHMLQLLDTPRDERFDCITRFTANSLHTPICLITFIDSQRQWFKSTYGIEVTEMSRDLSLCAHAICEINSIHPDHRVYQVNDTTKDTRFFDHPLVLDEPKMQSYMSYILQSDSGKNVGTLCVVDTRPRIFTDSEKHQLVVLGILADNLINGWHLPASLNQH